MRGIALFVAWILAASPAAASEGHGHASPGPAPLLDGLGRHHFEIRTSSPEAQRYFDQGLTLVYGFNHDEAIRSFRRAAELDPSAAMPHWGVAYALGPNINLPMDADRGKEAYQAIQKALTLAAGGPERERAYVEALAKRYAPAGAGERATLDSAYADAMHGLVERFPDDLDAATLYAESRMDLRPWQLWTLDGKPAEGTEEIVAVLESVLRRAPEHPGANHYYIHAVEASRSPERAMPSAARLETLVPNAGHLVHMPSHVYMRVGDYGAAARMNEIAAEVDRAYIEAYGVEGVYPIMYYGHNVHFIAVARAMEGRYEEAMREAWRVAEHVKPIVKEMPMAEFWMNVPIYVALRFREWKEILKSHEPGPEMPITRAMRRFARGMARAGTGKVAMAEEERIAFRAAAERVPADAYFSLNPAARVLRVAALELDARIEEARGAPERAIGLWREAVAAEDSLSYDEPPGWYHPVRESLGGALLRQGHHAEAEAVFREDLRRNPKNGRSLFGLTRALEAQGKAEEAKGRRLEFELAWKGADRALRVDHL